MTSDAIKEAVTKALVLAGLNPEDYRKAEAKRGEGVVLEEKAKVVVVGGGAAGMMAAIKLAQNGVDVLVIEKGATIGVANGWNCGGPMATNTSIQKAEGVTVTDEMLFNDLTDDAYLTSDSRLLRRVLARTGEAVELQLSTGMEMFLRPDNYGAGYRSRHGYKGQKADRPAFIVGAYEKAGGRLMCETTGESLIMENGEVKGVKARKSDGSTLNIRAEAVLLATGGYLGNQSLIKEHWGDITVNPLGNTLSTGDGLRMGKEAGGMEGFHQAGICLERRLAARQADAPYPASAAAPIARTCSRVAVAAPRPAVRAPASAAPIARATIAATRPAACAPAG